ncbi:hypothetical protein [Nocardioides daejeonensis]|uniref:hypothetical protein n=1 Tax=Nocardioides daejeonensis TaxID=1046556 RepID=UPI000D740809|nr:hypothetical protein [Nocardioides daejeonensis]
MKPGDEDEAWRQIVENYGDTPSVGDLASTDEPGASSQLPEETSAEALAAWSVDPDPEPEPARWTPEPWEDEGGFVPPPTPPFPWAEPRRLVAWLGVFLAPSVMLIGLVLAQRFPGWLSGLLVAWFVGGFLYLVATMPRGGRDPWDDGSRI